MAGPSPNFNSRLAPRPCVHATRYSKAEWRLCFAQTDVDKLKQILSPTDKEGGLLNLIMCSLFGEPPHCHKLLEHWPCSQSVSALILCCGCSCSPVKHLLFHGQDPAIPRKDPRYAAARTPAQALISRISECESRLLNPYFVRRYSDALRPGTAGSHSSWPSGARPTSSSTKRFNASFTATAQ